MADNKKDKPLAGGQARENSQADKLLKAKINDFLISYFNYLIFALSLIVLAAGLVIFIYPNYKQIVQENKLARENLQTEYETKLNYLNSIRSLKDSYQLITAADKDKIRKMVPVGDDSSGIITEIESIIVKNGAILNSVKIGLSDSGSGADITSGPGEKKELPAGIFAKLPAGVSRIRAEISLSSVNYPTLKNIIKTLENNLRLFDVAEIDFNSNDSKAVLTVYCYYL